MVLTVITESEHQNPRYSISDLAREFGVTTRTIRFYEDQGLLSPERVGRNRIFNVRDRVRLMLILRGKRLGFSLNEVAEIMDMYDTEPGESGQLKYFLDKISRRRQQLVRQKQDIDLTLDELERIRQQCQKRLDRL